MNNYSYMENLISLSAVVLAILQAILLVVLIRLGTVGVRFLKTHTQLTQERYQQARLIDCQAARRQDKYNSLQKIKALLDDGALSPQDYEREKEQIMDSPQLAYANSSGTWKAQEQWLRSKLEALGYKVTLFDGIWKVESTHGDTEHITTPIHFNSPEAFESYALIVINAKR